MITYLDASVLVALLTEDSFSTRAEEFLATHHPVPMLSDFAAAEFVSVIARRVRTRMLAETDARAVLSAFDVWSAGSVRHVACTPTDIAAATAFMRRLDLPLRTPDAIHLAIALRSATALATFDVRLAASATALGVPLAPA